MGVRDVNDNRPVFVDQEYFGTVAEEQPIGTSATLVSSLVKNELILLLCIPIITILTG